jgi:hypothetical protein
VISLEQRRRATKGPAMKSIGERAPLRGSGSTAEPLHVFTDRSRTGVQLHVHADHLELHAEGGKEVRAVWYRHIRTVGPSRESEGEALAIIDRGGHVLVVPMAHNHVMQALAHLEPDGVDRAISGWAWRLMRRRGRRLVGGADRRGQRESGQLDLEHVADPRRCVAHRAWTLGGTRDARQEERRVDSPS